MPGREAHTRQSEHSAVDIIVRWAWIVAGAIVGFALVGVGATYVTSAPAVCGGCHAMAPAVAKWRVSAHTQVGCPSCHETPRPWYRFPETLAVRSVMLYRDFGATVASAETSGTGRITREVPDEVCQQCHAPRSITMRFGTLIDHTEHAERNGSCVSCHLYTGHPDPDAERPLLLMTQCFTCHGRTATAKAPGTCETCHPPSFELKPSSHEEQEKWLGEHGPIAKKDRTECRMCHEESYCSACHGLEMPHPATWAKSESGHAAIAEKSRSLCAKCHKEKPDLCSMCHHKGLAASNRPWLAQHPDMVKQRSASMCLDCHVTTFCTHCHTQVAVSGAL